MFPERDFSKVMVMGFGGVAEDRPFLPTTLIRLHKYKYDFINTKKKLPIIITCQILKMMIVAHI